MKKIILPFIISLLALNLSAKKIKFAVDMATHTISPNGIHLIGDFQVLAGFGTMDWDPGTLMLTQESSSTVYSVILNLPAFQKYEYKFVNGDQTYEAEFVPDESRVGYNFNDNRWIYLDSLTNDTTYIGAIRFGGNAPSGKFLIRYLVDMSSSGGVSANGVHVGTSYQNGGFSPTKAYMYSFENSVHEVIDYVSDTPASYSYIFYNGNTLGNAESVPAACAVSGNRSIQVNGDTVLNTVCFSGCSACVTGLASFSKGSAVKLYPNPCNDVLKIENADGSVANVSIMDQQGRVLFKSDVSDETISTSEFENGLYLIKVSTGSNSYTHRLLISH